MHVKTLPAVAELWRRLTVNHRGIAMLEFALGMPVLLVLGGFGVEVANLALTNMRISQISLQLADNASRVGSNNGLAVFQLREGDINDVFQGIRLAGKSLQLTTYGRLTLSSLENIQQSYDTAPVQRIHWQRCLGLRTTADYGSSYGATTASAGSTATLPDAGTAAPSGMGDTGTQVVAPSGSGVIFVEVNYEYHPVFGTMFLATKKLHYTASFMVRDRRDFSQIFNPEPTATASSCDKYTA